MNTDTRRKSPRKKSRQETGSGNNTSIDSETHTMAGGVDDFEEVKVPLWIGEKFGGDPITGSKLTQLYTTFMGLHQLQKKKVLCDVNIKVGNKVFHAHKDVLAASSRFFRSMFTSGFQESRESDVSITGKPEAFQVILDYLYSCELTLSVDTVVDVLEMSHYLQLDLVMKRCEQFLIDEMNNGLELDAKAAVISLATARTYGLEVLIEAAKKCIAKNFTPTGSFLRLMKMELLEEILGRNDLKDEKQVFDTILAWLQHDWNKRKKFAPALFRKIRLGIVPFGHLSKSVFKYPKLYAIKECRTLIDTAMDMFDDRKTGDAPLHYTEPNLFATRTMINAIVSIDTDSGYYDVDTERWITLTKFPSLPEKDNNNNGDSCLIANGNLYVSRGTGSFPKKLKCPQFLRLDMSNNRWVALQPMNMRRQNAFLVAGSHKIFAIGGDVDNNLGYSGEVYNIQSDTWGFLPSLNFDNEPCKPTIESCKVYQDKLLVYLKKTIEGEDKQSTDKHSLKMYDSANSGVWTTLMEISYTSTKLQTIIDFVINDDKCYWIYCCACANHTYDQCPAKASIREIVVDFESKTARIGGRHEQDLLFTASKMLKAFRVNQDVYVLYKRQFFKTGIQIPLNCTDPVQLGSWKNLKQLASRQSVLFAQFMFDKEKWL